MNILKKIIILFLFASCATDFTNEDTAIEDKIKSNNGNSLVLKSKEVLEDSSFIVNRFPISGEFVKNKQKHQDHKNCFLHLPKTK